MSLHPKSLPGLQATDDPDILYTEEAESVSSIADMIRPCADKIAVLVASKSEHMPSGLFIPEDTARSIHEDRPTQGEIVALGADVEDFGIGDIVIFGKYTGTKIKYRPTKPDGSVDRTVDSQTVIVMNESAVLCVLLTPEQARNLKVRG